MTTTKAFLDDLEKVLAKHGGKAGGWSMDNTAPSTYTAKITLDGKPHEIALALDYEYWEANGE